MIVEKEMFLDVNGKQVGMKMIECQLAVSSTGVMQWLERSVDRRLWSIFTVRRYAKHGTYAVIVRLSVHLFVCVCLSHSGIVWKRLNVESRN